MLKKEYPTVCIQYVRIFCHAHFGHIRFLRPCGHVCFLRHCGHLCFLRHCGHIRFLRHCGHLRFLRHCGHRLFATLWTCTLFATLWTYSLFATLEPIWANTTFVLGCCLYPSFIANSPESSVSWLSWHPDLTGNGSIILYVYTQPTTFSLLSNCKITHTHTHTSSGVLKWVIWVEIWTPSLQNW